jgi:hypothetical protein
MAFSPDSRLLTAVSATGVETWNVAPESRSAEEISRFSAESVPLALVRSRPVPLDGPAGTTVRLTLHHHNQAQISRLGRAKRDHD